MKTIFLAEGEKHVRTALRLQIENQPGLHVTGEADHVESLLAQACQQLPDVILLSLNLPALHPQRLILALRKHCPTTRLIGTGVRYEQEQLAQEYQMDGFISQQLPPEKFMTELVRAISE